MKKSNSKFQLVFKYLSSLRTQLVLGGIGSMLVVFSLISYNTNQLFHEFAIESAQTNLKQVSETLNLVIAPFASNEEMPVLADYFKELIESNDKSIVYIAITNSNRNVLVKTIFSPPLLFSELPPIEEQMDSGIIHAKQSFLMKDNSIAELHYGLSTSMLIDAADRIRSRNFLLMSLVIVGALIVLLVALIRVSQRFNQLIQHSQSLASGHYSERLAVSGSDEIAQLSEHFNEMACAVEDRIDEIEKARHALIELNQTLESKVEQRTAQLHAQNKALDKALVHLKNTQDSLIQSEKMAGLGAMVAGVSHELNTPIGNALSVASSLNERTRGFIQETEQGLRKSSLISYRDYMTNAADLIERNLRRASDLITSFKHVAVDQTSSQCRKFNLKQTVHEILTTLAPSYKHTNHSIEDEIPTDINLVGYPGPLGQVITNLVNNAMIHAFENCPQGNIHIQAQIFNDDYIKLTVTDNGKGISPENLSKVFDPFFTTKLGQGGSGLGLNIVHNMVTGLMQGKIEVSSELNQGTCFALTLPLMIKEIE